MFRASFQQQSMCITAKKSPIKEIANFDQIVKIANFDHILEIANFNQIVNFFLHCQNHLSSRSTFSLNLK